MKQLNIKQHIHVVGIGGTGMSAIARVLLERGHPVSGSDRVLNPVTEALQRDGATIYAGHAASNIDGADMLVVSSAVHDNPEVAAAESAGIPVYKRKDFLPALLHGKSTLATAGTHGKPTTTAMTAHILREAGVDPGYIVGSVLANSGTNAAAGHDNHFVIEADEYDDMYLGLKPAVAVVTSAEWDHPDFFPTEADLLASFRKFIGNIQPDGTLIINTDDWRTQALVSTRPTGTLVTYGYNKRADAFIHNLEVRKDKRLHFDVYVKTPLPVLKAHFALQLMGRHNAANALAAALAAEAAGVPFEKSARALASFQSTGRRFEVRCEVDGLVVIDDYAHHPTAITVTLEAARMAYPQHRIWAVWQPHTYSRTQALMSGFAHAFKDADHVLVTDIYASREQPVPGIDSKSVVKVLKAHHPDVVYTGDLESTAARLLKKVRGRSVVIIFSAGDAPRIGQMLQDSKKA